VKPIVSHVTDRGITGVSDKHSSPELTNDRNPLDDDDDAGFQEPPSEKQFKDEDLFYLPDTPRESDLTDDITSTESSAKCENSDSSVFGDEFKGESDETDLTEELRFSKSQSDIQLKDKDLHGKYGNSGRQDYIQPTESVHLLDVHKTPTNSSSAEYAHDFSSPVLSQSFSTKRPHRFRTPTTTLPPITSESRTVQSMIVSSTEEQLEQKVFSTKSTSEPHTSISYIDAEDLATHLPNKLIRNDDIGTRRPVRYRPTHTPVSLPTASTTISPATEEPVTIKLKPIFVEIIHRDSSEPPLLKSYTVEELERKRSTTKSPLSAEGDNLLSINPGGKAGRPQTMGAGEMSTTLTVAPSPVTISRRGRPPKKLTSLTPIPDITPTKLTTSVPPTTAYVTLSRKVQPPVLILTSSDPHDKNRMISNDTPPESSTFGTMDASSSTDYTAAANPVTLSREVQPPLPALAQFSSRLSTPTASTVRQDRQEIIIGTANRKASVSLQTVKNDSLENTEKQQLPQKADFEHDILVSTESSSVSGISSNSEPTKNYITYAGANQHQATSEPSPITTLRQWLSSAKQKTMTDTTDMTTPSLNPSLEKVSLTGEPTAVSDIPISLALKQEPTSSPQYRNRDGLAIPASSGPSTLHSLAVYFASKDSNQETTVDISTDFYSKKHKGKGGKTVTESVPTVSSILQYDSTVEGNKTDTLILAPNFLTKSIRDSYSVLFPNTREEQNTTTEEPVRFTPRTAEKSSAKIKTKDRKGTHSSHNVLRSELLDKLAEISEMEAKPPSEKIIPSPERGVLHADTEDLLQGTDSRDLRELAQIFSRALSAYLEDPEGFKRVLSEVRPQDPSSVYMNDVKRVEESNQFSSTTISSVSSSTAIPLTTSSTEYFSVTQEDEEVLDFSDVSKVSRNKSKSTTLIPPYSKSLDAQKLKYSDSASYVNSAVETTSRESGIGETASKPSSIESLEEIDLKPPEEGLQNAQSTYYTSSNGQVPLNTVDVSPEVFENPQTDKGSGADYTLPPGTEQYRGPGYGPQPGEVHFAPTAGGVNDPSRPRYGGFQNNSGISAEEPSVQNIDTQGTVKATTFVPEVRYETRSTVRPVSTIADVEKPAAIKVTDEFGNILNTFEPEEVNNLAIVGSTPQTPGTSLTDENVTKHVQPYNLMSNLNAALLDANTTSYTSSPVSQPSNPLSVEQKWSSLGNIVDALTINRELSESDIEERSSTDHQEFSSSLVTTQRPSSTTKPVVKTRHRSTTESYISEPTVPVVTLPDIPGPSAEFQQTQRNRHFQLELEAESANSSEGLSYNSNPQEHLQPLDISGVTFYSEKIKPLPPASASLIQVSVSQRYKDEPSIHSSSSKYMSGKVSVLDNDSKEISVMTTSTADIPLRKQPISIRRTYSPTVEPESILSLHKSGTKNRSFPRQQGSRSAQEPAILQEELKKNVTLGGAAEMSLPPQRSMPASFTESPFSDISPTAETTTVSWKQETKESEQEITNVNLQPVQSSVRVPISVTTPPSRGSTPLSRTKNTAKKPPYYNEGVVPSTSMPELAFIANSRSVIVPTNNNTSSRGTKFSEKHKSLNKNVTPTELKEDASNSQQSVRISTMVSSTESPTSLSSTTLPTFMKIFFSNQSLTAVPGSSVETDLRMDNVTTDQLQALEDIQTMLFPVNSTVGGGGTMIDNLNQSSTLSLINTMKQVVTNSTVRRLVLLLVNGLKENTPEETRSHLIAALLRMPVDRKLSEVQQVPVSTLLHQRIESSSEKSNGEYAPITVSQYKSHPSVFLEKSSQISITEQPVPENKHLTATQASATKSHTRERKYPQVATPQAHPTTVAVQSKGRRPVRLRSTTDSSWTSSLEKDSGSEDLPKGDPPPQSDTRAVELLRSLYSLASRWG
jgi:hypothetical protein